MSGSTRVQLVGVPVALWQRASAHQEALQREFDIIRAELPAGSVPHQLLEMMTELDDRFGGAAAPARKDLSAAVERGDEEVTLVYTVPSEAAAAAKRLIAMMDRVDEYCRAGDELLTLATPPELVSFRNWFAGEFIRQIEEGLPPVAWSEWEEETPPTVAAARPRAGTSEGRARSVRFEGDLDLATAGALRDEILGARNGGMAVVTVDLSRVQFVDSVGLSLLVTARNRLDEEGVEMRLVLPEKLRLLFEISGLVEVLQPEFVGQAPRPAPTGEGR